MAVLLEPFSQRLRIVRRMHLVGIVEVDKYIARPIGWKGPAGKGSIVHWLAVAPRFHAARPPFDFRRAVGTVVELLGAVQSAIDEVRREIHQQRPVHGVGADQRDVVLAQQVNERRIAEAFVPNLHGVTDRPVSGTTQPRPRLEAMVVLAPAGGGLAGIARQELEEGRKLLAVEAEVGWKLPEDRTELGTQPQRA